MFFYRWWAGLAVLIFLTPALSGGVKRSAGEFVIEYALENPEFYEYLITSGAIRVRPKAEK